MIYESNESLFPRLDECYKERTKKKVDIFFLLLLLWEGGGGR